MSAYSEITLTVGQLRGLLKVAAESDVRYYLCGVCAQPWAGRAVSTDGHILLFTPAVGNGPDFIIPSDAAREIVKKPRDKDTVTIRCDNSNLEGRATRHDYRDPSKIDSLVDFKAVDGRYPNVDRVLPDKFTGETAQFDARLLSRLDAGIRYCLAGLDEKNAAEQQTQLFHNGESAGLLAHVGYPELAIGIIMPFRATKVEYPSALVDEFRDKAAKARAA